MAAPKLKVLDGGAKPTRRRQPQKQATAAQKAAPAKSAPAPRAKTLAQAIATDDAIAEAKALRILLARRIADPKTSAVAVAALTKQLRELGGGQAEQPSPPDGGGDEGTGVDAAADETWDEEAL